MFESVKIVWNHAKERVDRVQCQVVTLPELSLDVRIFWLLHTANKSNSQSPIISVLHHTDHAKVVGEIIKSVIEIQNKVIQEIYTTFSNMKPNDRPATSTLLDSPETKPIDVSCQFSVRYGGRFFA